LPIILTENLTFLANLFALEIFFSNFAEIFELIVRVKFSFSTIFCLIFILLLTGCDFKLKPFSEVEEDTLEVRIQRYDRMESLFLTTGDFSALQQMSTDYPNETRTLIETILGLGSVDDPEINSKLLRFYQDSTLQAIISDAELQYANMDDLNKLLTESFHKLKVWIPGIKVPLVYAQICALDQSIIVGNESVGICLDKYLGKDYPLYKRYYDEEQRKTMQRDYIVPDFLSFYLLSIYQLPNFRETKQEELDLHVAKIQWVVNKVLGNKFFHSSFLNIIDQYMARNPGVTIEELLTDNDVRKLRK